MKEIIIKDSAERLFRVSRAVTQEEVGLYVTDEEYCTDHDVLYLGETCPRCYEEDMKELEVLQTPVYVMDGDIIVITYSGGEIYTRIPSYEEWLQKHGV